MLTYFICICKHENHLLQVDTVRRRSVTNTKKDITMTDFEEEKHVKSNWRTQYIIKMYMFIVQPMTDNIKQGQTKRYLSLLGLKTERVSVRELQTDQKYTVSSRKEIITHGSQVKLILHFQS